MKSRKLKILSFLSLVLLAVLVTAVWLLTNDSWIKGKVEETVSNLTGRSLLIDGGFTLDWSTNPVLLAEKIHLSNPAWASNPDLVDIEKLEVSIDLFSILTDQIQINYIVIDGLVIALEEHESGDNSWDIDFGQGESVPTDKEPSEELPIKIDRISLTDFTLLHEASDRTVPLDFHLNKLQLSQRADLHLQFSTDGRFGGEEFSFAGNLGPLNALVMGGRSSHEVRLTLSEIVLQSQGSVEGFSNISGANIKLDFSGPEFEWILTQLALPEFSHGDFDFRLDVQSTANQTHLNLDGDLGSLQANAKGDFKELGVTGNLTADVSGEDLGGLLEVAGVSGIPRKPFSLKVDISHASGLYQLQTMMLETAGNKVSVSGQIGDWPQLADTELEITAYGPNLQNWGNALHTEMLPDVDFELSSHISRAGGDPVSTDTKLRLGDSGIQISGSLGRIPAMDGANLLLTANGPVDGALVQMLGIKGIPGKDLSLSATIERDSAFYYLHETSFDLGNNHLELSGKIGNWPELSGTNLTFSLDGQNLSVWAPLLKMEELPASAFSLRGGISPTTVGLALDTVRLKLGDAHFVVNGIVGEAPKFVGTELNIDAEGPSLDEFRFIPGLLNAPALPFKVNGNIGRHDSGLVLEAVDLKLGDNAVQLTGQLGLEDQWKDSHFQTRIVIPDLASLGPLLGVENLPASELSMQGNFQRTSDGWAFQLSNGRFADAVFESDGKYIDTNGRQIVEASSQLTAPNLARFARVAGIENLPEQAIEIQGFARYSAGEIVLREIQGKVGNSQFNVTANLKKPSNWSGSELLLSASGQDIGQLLANRDFEEMLAFSIDGGIKKGDQGIQVNQVKISVGPLRGEADGIIGNLEDLSATDFKLALAAPSLQELGELVDFPLPDEPFHMNARFQGSPSVFQLEKLDIKLGSSDLSGDMTVDLEARPRVNGVFQSKNLDLTWLQSADEGSSTTTEPAEAKKKFLIPDSVIELPQLDFMDSDLEIKVGRIEFVNQSWYDLYLHSRVTEGNLILDPFQLRGEKGGLLRGTMTVVSHAESAVTDVEFAVEGNDVRLGIGTVEGQDPDTIREAEIFAKLNATGATYRELASSLNGRIEVVQGAGLTGNAGFGLIFGNFIGEIFDLINPFSKTEKFTRNECDVITVNIDSGVITVEPVVSQTDKMTLVAKGVVDLNTEKLQFTFNTKLRKGVGISASMLINPFVSVTGTLMSPTVGLDPSAVAVKGTVAVATVGISLLVRSLSDRYFSSKDPCGDAIKQSREQLKSLDKKGK